MHFLLNLLCKSTQYLAIFSLFIIAGLIWVTPTHAQDLGSIQIEVEWESNFGLPTKHPVDILTKGLPLKYRVINSTPDSLNCQPIPSTIGNHTVQLTDQQGNSYPAHTVSSHPSGDGGFYRFQLRTHLQHFQLPPNRQFSLKLIGENDANPHPIEFECNLSSGAELRLPLSTTTTLHFSTGNDTVKPIILEQGNLPSLNSAIIYWKASEKVVPEVLYGTSAQNLSAKVTAKAYDLWYVAEIKNMKPGTKYFYSIPGRDADNHQLTATNTTTKSFTTWRISPITISERTGHEVSIKWTTSIATDSMIEYGTTTNLDKRSGSHAQSTVHNIRLNNLNSHQKYYARISLNNGNVSAKSDIFTFSTLDASAGFSPEDIVVEPEFVSNFDFSNFNFWDFPLTELQSSSSAQQASGGAVLASTDSSMTSIAGNFEALTEAYPWLVWLWIPILLLLGLILAVWLLLRHERKVKEITSKSL